MSDPRRRWFNDRVVARAHAPAHPGLTAVDPVDARVRSMCADLALSPCGPRARQLIYGQDFAILETRDELVFGVSRCADYAGWIARARLTPVAGTPVGTEGIVDGADVIVQARLTHAYIAPDFKSPERMALSCGSRLRVSAKDGIFANTEAGWVPRKHLATAHLSDPVSVAETLLGTPYLWGGNSALGIDCSGLVHVSLASCGLRCPGDSDLQQVELGDTLPMGTEPRRGDLLFWRGHVALCVDAEQLIHANAHRMAVSYEPIAEAVARIEAQGDGPLQRHARLPSLEQT